MHAYIVPSHASDTGTRRDPPSDTRTITHRHQRNSRQLTDSREYTGTYSPANALQQTATHASTAQRHPQRPADRPTHKGTRTRASRTRAPTPPQPASPAPQHPEPPYPSRAHPRHHRRPLSTPGHPSSPRQPPPEHRDQPPNLPRRAATHPTHTSHTHTPHPQTPPPSPHPTPSSHHHQSSSSFASLSPSLTPTTRCPHPATPHLQLQQVQHLAPPAPSATSQRSVRRREDEKAAGERRG